MTAIATPERLWRIELSCGHSHEVYSFIGDFDYAVLHDGVPEFCPDCRDLDRDPIVKLVSAEVIAVGIDLSGGI